MECKNVTHYATLDVFQFFSGLAFDIFLTGTGAHRWLLSTQILRSAQANSCSWNFEKVGFYRYKVSGGNPQFPTNYPGIGRSEQRGEKQAGLTQWWSATTTATGRRFRGPDVNSRNLRISLHRPERRKSFYNLDAAKCKNRPQTMRHQRVRVLVHENGLSLNEPNTMHTRDRGWKSA